MAQVGQLQRVASNPATDFTAGLAQNAGQQADIPIPNYQGGTVAGRIRSLAIVSKDNLAWEVEFFRRTDPSKAANGNGSTAPPLAATSIEPATDTFAGTVVFASTDGKQIGATGLWRYFIAALDIPYTDDDSTGKIHAVLVNRSAGSKTAGAGGNILVAVYLEETLAW